MNLIQKEINVNHSTKYSAKTSLVSGYKLKRKYINNARNMKNLILNFFYNIIMYCQVSCRVIKLLLKLNKYENLLRKSKSQKFINNDTLQLLFIVILGKKQ